MDDAWRIKCGSPWLHHVSSSPSPAQPAAAPQLLAPPPIVATSQVLPPGSGNQLDIYSHQRCHPFISKEANMENHSFTQDPVCFSSLNTGPCKTSKREMGQSFLALLSGPSHPLAGEFLLSKLGSSLPTSKLPACDIGNVATAMDFSVLAPFISADSVHHGSNTAMTNASEHLSSNTMGRSPMVSSSSQSTVSCNEFQLLGCQFPNSNTGSFTMSQAHQDTMRGLTVPSTSNINSTQLQKTNILTCPIRQADVGMNISSHASSFIRGCPRVFCRDKVGELFVSDNGLLGVFCLCHSFRMSVAKFCEHSGSHTVNPGDAVHLGNGETVAQWRRLFFLNIGVRVPDDGSGWDWPDGIFMHGRLGRSTDNNLQKPNYAEAFELQEPLFEVGRSTGLPSGHVSHFPYAENTASESPLNVPQEYDESRKTVKRAHIGSICTTSSVNEQSVKVVKENQSFMSPSILKHALDTGEHNGVNHDPCVTGEARNSSTIYQSPGPAKYFSNNTNCNRTHISSNSHLMDKGSTSKVELRLGQPSQQNYDCIGLNTDAMHPQQLLEHFGLQKQQAHHLISQASVGPVVPEKTMQSLYHTPSQVSTSSRNWSRHACGNLDAMHMSEQVVNSEADENSLISLFLSHFSTSGNKAKPQLGDEIISKSENVVPNLIDHNEIISKSENAVPNLVDHNSPSKCSMIDFSRNANNGIEAKSNVNVTGFSNQMEKRKDVRVSFEDEFYTGKNCSYVQNKQRGDLRVFAEVSDGYSSHNISSSDEQNSAYFHQSFSRLLVEPDARHSNECEQMSFLVNRDTNVDAVLRCRNAGTGCLSPSLANNFSSSNPIYISGPPSPLSNKMNADVIQNFVDVNMGFPALNHVLKLSKLKHLPASLEMSDQGRQSCSSAIGATRKGSKENPITCDDLKHDQHSNGLQEASNLAFRSVHSCCDCCSCGFARNLTSKTCTAGTSRVCSQTGFICDSKLYSKDTHVKPPFCHLCNDDGQSVLRHFRTDNQIAGLADYEVFNQKDGNGYITGKCGCRPHMKCLEGCHYRGKGPSDLFKEHGNCGKTHNTAPAYDLDHMTQDGKKVSPGLFNGSRHVNMSDNCQSAFCRDVACGVLVNSASVIVQNRADTLPATGLIDGKLTENTAKDFDGTCEEIDSKKEQQISNIYSACSAPVITEISTEVNNLDSYTGGSGICRSSFDPVIDEGSVIETCGSSDDVMDNTKWDESVAVKSKVEFQKVSDYASGHASKNKTGETNHQSGDFVIEANVRKSFIPRKKRNQSHAEYSVKECTLHREPFKRGWRAERKKKATKWRRLDGSFTASGLSLFHPESNYKGYLKLKGSSDGLEVPDHHQKTTVKACISVTLNKFKGVDCKHCASSSVESLPCGICDDHHRVGKYDAHIELADYDSSNRTSKSSTGKKFKKKSSTSEKEDSEEQENSTEVTKKNFKGMPTFTKGCLTGKKCSQERMAKPVVRDNLGIISIGSLSGKSKPVKIVSLSSVLKLAKRCSVIENEKEPGGKSELQMAYAGCFSSKRKTPEMSLTLGEKDTGVRNLMPKSKSNPRGKETRKRRLSELTGNSEDTKDALCLATSGTSECSKLTQAGFHLKESLVMGATDDLVGPKPQDKKGEMRPILKCSQQSHCRTGKFPQQSQNYAVCPTSARKFPNKGRRCKLSPLNSDAFCCVCGSSNKDDINYLLECNNCLIRVHQACYGISKVPKGHWSCRPCRINSKNIACVLCGYEGGAMTRAVRSRNIVKSLLKVWKEGRGYLLTRSAQAHTADGARALSPYSKVHNSITAGALDPTITQWVHVVCGLWTPGTRCPNVDTMSAFDVSGALPATRRMVCSMCNRPGGSCIQCRVVGCSTHFHPWCAHQKSLLQSETEGVDDENVGFYGRCLLHATHHDCHSDGIQIVAGLESPGVKEFSCARTEGYKGRKEHGLTNAFHSLSNNNFICSVPQEQLNAWLRINGQKSCTRDLPTPSTSEPDYDCQKEYARYKQMKGWKHLVVYKSRIHALGLYTSQFIPRGAMVVEYVGEIVGLRVADKREIEYQSGKKLQYKSACYFFRIDKGHIIDATRKGGIARFVNHSCLPNCVAKVVSVKNEKKVVFFAERDINAGEEITYDYHFNHEEEGKKIPCFCNSRNCRRYLN